MNGYIGILVQICKHDFRKVKWLVSLFHMLQGKTKFLCLIAVFYLLYYEDFKEAGYQFLPLKLLAEIIY